MSDTDRRDYRVLLTNGADDVLAYARNIQSVMISIFCQAAEKLGYSSPVDCGVDG